MGDGLNTFEQIEQEIVSSLDAMAELDLAYGDMPQLILFTLWMSSSHRLQLGACIC